MSAETFDLGLRVVALRENRPVRRASTNHVELRADADVVVVVTMTGEPDAIWGVSYGQWSGSRLGFTTSVADPRIYGQQVELFAAFGQHLRTRHDRHAGNASWYPQLVMLSDAAFDHLHAAAARIAYSDNPDARYAAEMVMWCAERSEHPGSQAVIILSRLLAEHWVPPSPSDEDSLLDTWLACFAGRLPASAGRLDSRGADDHPDDARTTPEFDMRQRNKLERVARAKEADRSLKAKTAAAAITPTLNAIATARFKRARALLGMYAATPNPTLPGVELFAAEDCESWGMFRSARDAGFNVARTDRFKTAVRGLLSREQHVELHAGLLCLHDALCRERAVHEGRVLRGVVVAGAPDEVTVATDQPILRFRPGTNIQSVGAVNLDGRITDLRVDGETTQVTIQLDDLTGDRIGEQVEFIEKLSTADANQRSRINVAQRLKTLRWTHDVDLAAPRSLGRAVPADVRQFAESLRSQ